MKGKSRRAWNRDFSRVYAMESQAVLKNFLEDSYSIS